MVLFRVRAFTQDDAHIFCTADQIEEEIMIMITMVFEVIKKFGFENIDVAFQQNLKIQWEAMNFGKKQRKALHRCLRKH